MDFYRKQPVISIGVLSLITIFTVLLITSFAMLIFLSAQKDMTLSELTAKTVTAYYNADLTAEENFAKVDELWQTTTSSFDLENKIINEGFHILQGAEYDGMLVYYDIPISDKKYLHVEIGIPENKNELDRLSWRIMATDW